MKTRIFISLLLCVLILISCKKKDKDPAPAPSGGGGTTTGGNLSPSDSTKFYGIFDVNHFISTGVYTVSGASAYFSSQPVALITSSTSVAVERVYYNGDSLVKSGVNYFSTGSVNVGSQTWSVSGGNGIPSFSFTDPNAMPSFTANLPDSISKSTGFILTVQVAGASTVFGSALLSVGDNTTSYSMLLSNGDNTVNITPAHLNNIGITDNGHITISMSNSKAYAFSQKPFQFRRNYGYREKSKIKP